MGMKVNTSGYEPKEGGSFGPIIPSKFWFQITGCKEKTSKTLKEMFELELTIIRDAKTKDEKNKGRKIWYYIVEGEYCNQNIIDVFNSARVDISTLPEEINAKDFLGQVVQAQTKNREFRGEMQPDINYFVNPPDDAERTAFKDKAGSVPEAPAPEPSDAPADDPDVDDIPF